MLLEKERNEVVAYCRMMQTHQLTKGTGGNISIRNRDLNLIAISPSGVEYSTMRPEDVVVVHENGAVEDGSLKPSSELGMHLAILNRRPELNAIVHTHSMYAVTLACAHLELPAIHYMIGVAGTDRVPCIPYYPFGSAELADAAGKAFADDPQILAILLGNHGLICGGLDIASAFNCAEELEFVSEIYYRQLTMGVDMHILSTAQMEDVLHRFAGYGQK